VNPTTGIPQGGIISPILANIYLYYTLDLWVERVVRKECKGEVVYQRYADDFVLGFEYGYELRMLSQFFNAARWTIYRVLNERSEKTSYNWKGFKEMWKTLDIPNPKIIEIHRPQRTCALNLT